MREFTFTPPPAIPPDPYEPESRERWKTWWEGLIYDCHNFLPLTREEKPVVLQKLADLGLSARLVAHALSTGEASISVYCGKHDIKLQGREPQFRQRNEFLKGFLEEAEATPPPIGSRPVKREEEKTKEEEEEEGGSVSVEELLADVAARYEVAVISLCQEPDWRSRSDLRKIHDIANRVGHPIFAVKSFLRQHPDLTERYALQSLVPLITARVRVSKGRR